MEYDIAGLNNKIKFSMIPVTQLAFLPSSLGHWKLMLETGGGGPWGWGGGERESRLKPPGTLQHRA